MIDNFERNKRIKLKQSSDVDVFKHLMDKQNVPELVNSLRIVDSTVD